MQYLSLFLKSRFRAIQGNYLFLIKELPSAQKIRRGMAVLFGRKMRMEKIGWELLAKEPVQVCGGPRKNI